jgi:hypothetical protein
VSVAESSGPMSCDAAVGCVVLGASTDRSVIIVSGVG